MIKNKRADIPVTILVLGVVGVCILTIISFVNSGNDVSEDFLGIGLIETMLSIQEELSFYSNPETEFTSGDYDERFERGNVEIFIGGSNVISGSYTTTEQRFIRGCNKDWFEFLKKCPKELIRIEYKN